MASFEDRFCLTQRNLASRLGRDARLILYLARLAWGWLWIGGRVRRAYRACRQSGRTYWLDSPPTDHV